jgi:tyrosine-protein phosphatase SIW14
MRIGLRRLRPVPALITVSIGMAWAQAASTAEPPGVYLPGITNFHQVDEHVYRGAQPHGEGFAGLAKLGIKTVIDLRGEKSEETAVEGAGMRYVRLAWSGYKAPADSQIAAVLSLLNDNSAWPVFVHCKRGADRTGTAIACYRIAHDHWTNQQALEEARSFGMSSMEIAMQHFILRFAPPAITATTSVPSVEIAPPPPAIP